MKLDGLKNATGEVRIIVSVAEEGVSVEQHAVSEFENKLLDLDVANEGPPNLLKVAVIQARDLPVMDKKMFGSGGSSDPVVTLSCLKLPKQKTKVVKKSLEPRWREIFEFEVDEHMGDGHLALTVDDWDLASGNDFMGPAAETRTRSPALMRTYIP